MIITEETQWSRSTASMETANGRGPIEQALFGQTGANNELLKSRVPKGDAPGWASNTSQYISKLNSTNKVGPNQLLKVMAGDQLSTTVQYFYQTPVTNSSGSTVFNDVLGMLASAITGTGATSAATKNAATTLTGNLNTGTPFSQLIASDITSPTGDKPKAYLNIVFFDERFNFVEEASASRRVSQSGDSAAALGLLNIKAPKNGYCFVYISNESSANVFFDNLQVRHDRGRIIEENHYYAHGLKIAAISSKAYGAPNSNYLYQGDFSEMDDDLGWNDFELRSYDPQIGRFLQNDPYDQFASGYVGMGNDPGNGVDPSGGFFGGPVPGGIGKIGAAINAAAGFGNIASGVGRILSIAINAICLTSQGISVGQNKRGHNQNARQSVSGNLYKSRDAAAVAWAMENNEDPDIDKNEFSSAIFGIIDKDGIERYGYTARIKFEDDDDHGENYNYGNSPGPDDDLHLSSLPEGGRVIDHIHSHTGKDGATNNGYFGIKDLQVYGLLKGDRRMYLVGNSGILFSTEAGKLATGLKQTKMDGIRTGIPQPIFNNYNLEFRNAKDLLPVGNWRKTKWSIPTWPKPIKINTDFPYF